ncbi:MAG: NYN domain-containing protein, partial [Planctomycetota bacterium]|nr:NYN domain-containing protein [Planctomycetota bacterium]
AYRAAHFIWDISAMRTNVYVDGFNLYYGAVKDTKFKWLNLQRYFELLLSHDDIQTVYYFTAEISGSHHAHQMTYLRALATLPKVEIVFGKFKLKTITCGVKVCDFSGERLFKMPEEKRTDVQIALRMARYCWEDACDRFVLVSGDSDLVPAVNLVKEICPGKQVIVYIPARNPERATAVELRAAADKARILPNELIRKTQFQAKFPDGFGGFICKPANW